MNFYKHHLGDYDGDTQHLSWDEDMAYTRLLRAYYRREGPIPLEPRDAYRLTRASSAAQRRAVDAVLGEFFLRQADGWHNKRADEEIAAYLRQAAANRAIAQGRKRGRTVDDSLHDSSHESTHEPSDDSSTDRIPSHKPDTRNQKPITDATPVATTTPRTPAGASPVVRTGQIAIQIRGLDKSRNKRSAITSQHPKLLEWAKAGVTDEQIREAYDLAASARDTEGDPGPINANYLDAFVRKVLNPPASKPNGEWWASEEATKAKARELGMGEARGGEEWSQFRQRIRDELEKRKVAA